MTRSIAALIRHGEYHQKEDTPSAHQPYPLTPEGVLQAEQAAREIQVRMEQEGWRLSPVVDCSRLLRGWQTAKIISDRLEQQLSVSIELQPFDSLAERSLGSAANLTIGEIERILDDDPRFDVPPDGWKADSHYRLPLQGAESLLEAGERIATHLQHRLSSPVTQNGTALTLFVGHGAGFRHAAYHLGVLKFDDLARLSMHHAQPVYLERLANGVWRQVGGEWKIRRDPADARD